MKKTFLIVVCSLYFLQNSLACAGYDPSDYYFNLFTQHIIADKSFIPFLLDYQDFYSTDKVKNTNANILEWQKYFNEELTYEECSDLVYRVSMEELNNLKFGRPVQDKLLKALGKEFYDKYKEGFDYLIEAKYLQPYMCITHQENENSYYYYNENQKDASDIDFKHTRDALISLYNASKTSQIKLRYGYQLVRFLHYTRNFQDAINAFKRYVAPLKKNSEVYYMALEQYAGALRAVERGGDNYGDSNWQFFQVFVHSKNRKKSAFLSLTLAGDADFNSLLNKAQTEQEKIMAHFLLGYQGFNNPLPMMKKIANINPNSEALKVLQARAINELERGFLPCFTPFCAGNKVVQDKEESIPAVPKKLSFWDRIVNFFKNLFGIGKDDKKETPKAKPIELKEEKRLPMFLGGECPDLDSKTKAENQLSDLVLFTEGHVEKSEDEFWTISYAYLKFLQKKYKESSDILAAIQTENTEYQEQIANMRMLNDIVGQELIDDEFEEHLLQDYPNLFVEDGDVKQFIFDILANRYFLQGEKAKSFLIHNDLSNIGYNNANLALVKELEVFYKKENKSTLEKEVLSKRIDVADPDSFFHFIYGDAAMRHGEFAKAKSHYDLVKNGKGFIPTNYTEWDREYKKEVHTSYEEKALFDGFYRISDYIFGHNYWESFESAAEKTMETEPFVEEFSFIKKTMNKAELAEVLVRLEKIGKDNNKRAAHANQLIGNFFYNTSKLGYYRHVFVMDLTNGNGWKYHFNSANKMNKLLYYKDFYWGECFNETIAFDSAIHFYKKSLESSVDKEQKARILFQMASAEQGNYYQWESEQPEVSWKEPNWYERRKAQELEFAKVKRQRFNTYFEKLKAEYADTEAVEVLEDRCSNFRYFLNH